MKEQEIRKCIDRLNKGLAEESIFTRQISKNVKFAKVWTNQPKVTDNITNFDSFNFFFIKNESDEYVGAVQDLGHDLHWYIVPKSRKKGYLTTALKESILPYLFYGDREIQKITIDKGAIGEKKYLNSKSVAISLGFKPTNEDETEFELSKENFNWNNENFEEVNSYIDPARFQKLRKKAFYAYKLLYKISDELQMAFDNDKKLKKVVNKVKNYTWKIEDIEREYKKRKTN